jgi:uncharacterized protein YceK
LSVSTSASACVAPAITAAHGSKHSLVGIGLNALKYDPRPLTSLPASQTSLAMVGLLLVAALGRRSRRLGAFAGVCILLAISLGVSGCAGVSSSPAPPSGTPTAGKGTYTVTIVGTDTTTTTITTSTTMTLTID